MIRSLNAGTPDDQLGIPVFVSSPGCSRLTRSRLPHEHLHLSAVTTTPAIIAGGKLSGVIYKSSFLLIREPVTILAAADLG